MVATSGRCHRCSFSVPGSKLFVYAERLDGDERAASDVTASQLWPSSRGAASYLATHARDRSVCELGCGLGAPSLAAAYAGCRVLATDVDGEALDRVSRAAKDQGVGTSRLAEAVHVRVKEAFDRGARVLVSLETSRPQRDALVRFLQDSNIPYSPPSGEDSSMVVLQTVDENDPSLY